MDFDIRVVLVVFSALAIIVITDSAVKSYKENLQTQIEIAKIQNNKCECK